MRGTQSRAIDDERDQDATHLQACKRPLELLFVAEGREELRICGLYRGLPALLLAGGHPVRVEKQEAPRASAEEGENLAMGRGTWLYVNERGEKLPVGRTPHRDLRPGGPAIVSQQTSYLVLPAGTRPVIRAYQ